MHGTCVKIINGKYFLLQDWCSRVHNGGGMCLLWRSKCIFNYYLDSFRS